jgi:hypothetical protein
MKFWKRWPYWVKGGLAISGVLTVLDFIYYASFFRLNGLGCFFTPIYSEIECAIIFRVTALAELINSPLDWVSRSVYAPTVPLAIVFSIVFVFSYFFIIGAILGWLYGRIKGRSSPKLTAES